MPPGVIQIHDLNGAGKVLVGQIPDPDGSVPEDYSNGGPLPASARGLGIDAEAELFGGFDGSYEVVESGSRMGQPSSSTWVCVNTQPSVHSRVRARSPSILPVRPSVSAA